MLGHIHKTFSLLVIVLDLKLKIFKKIVHVMFYFSIKLLFKILNPAFELHTQLLVFCLVPP